MKPKLADPIVKPHIADKVIASDSAAMRAKGAAIVAKQLENSATFKRYFWIAVVLCGGASLWLRSWVTIVVAALLLGVLYTKLIAFMGFKFMRDGERLEYQAAYKRLYYSDPEFRKQVDDLLASTKQKSARRH